MQTHQLIKNSVAKIHGKITAIFSVKHLIVVLFFISCNNFSKGNKAIAQDTAPKASTETLDILKIKRYPITAKPEIFETAFFEGTQTKVDTFLLNFYSVNMGKISVESGKIIAGDPIVMKDLKPFKQAFPIGEFPVWLSVAKIGEDERVAFSQIVFNNNSVSKWEMALKEGQKPKSIFDEEFYGYGVDGGTGVFIDEKANKAFTDSLKKDDDLWSDVFAGKIVNTYRNTWEHILYNFNGHNLAAFSTGWGDGYFGTYIGYDDKGQICRLLTDFDLVNWRKMHPNR